MCSQWVAQTRQKSCMAPAIIQDDQDELSNSVQPQDSFYLQFKKLNFSWLCFYVSLRPLTTQRLFLCFICNGRGSDAEKTHLDLKAVQVKSAAYLKFSLFSKSLYEQVIPNKSHDRHHVSRVIISPCFQKLWPTPHIANKSQQANVSPFKIKIKYIFFNSVIMSTLC